jgi:Domain of unknown function (DUF4832)/Domain of unknown function (DUF4874)
MFLKKIYFISCVMLLSAFVANAQIKKIVYKESLEEFTNPERGFYVPMEARSGNYKPLNAEQLQAFRSPKQVKGLSAPLAISLIYRGFLLDSFLNEPLSDSFLEKIKNDFATIRSSGLKIIIRFAYTNKTHTGDCPDQYKICPPYGDASKKIVLQHIQQLKPLLQENADIIALVQMGFIGIWGENYFTDYFGDASTNGLARVMDSSWNDRNEVLKALLDAVPKDRMIDVRTPQIKQRFVNGPSATVNAAPLKLENAFTKTDESRIGFHNDCFLASVDDYGTFYDYGNSSSKRGPANDVLRKYFIEDSKYIAVGGETCDNTFSPQNDCGPAGYAEKEMRSMHYSYLNSSYNMDVIKDWENGGCFSNINRSLGYRFVLKEIDYPETVVKEKTFHIKMELENTGFASPFNPRNLWLVLRNQKDNKEYFILCNDEIQKWFSGKINCNENITFPSTVPPGKYELLLNLPDKYESLSKRPEYSIRLANENMWEEKTGYNKLNAFIIIK